METSSRGFLQLGSPLFASFFYIIIALALGPLINEILAHLLVAVRLTLSPEAVIVNFRELLPIYLETYSKIIFSTRH